MFVTDGGVAVPAVTTAQMREVDRVAIEETGPNLFQMMENAGRDLAATVLAHLGGEATRRMVLVLAGTGGNGGGGIVAARHLANRGVAVNLMIPDDSKLSDVPRAQFETFRHSGGDVVAELPAATPHVVIDALIGYSLVGAPRGTAADMIGLVADLSSRGAWVISLDIPSGMDATTGARPGPVVAPNVTLTLALPKTGLVAEGAGSLLLGDLGIPAATYRRSGIAWDGPVFDDRFVVGLSRGESGG